MPNTVDKIRIHNALIAAVLAGPFFAVTYDPDTKLALDVDVDVDTPVSPASLQANEIAAAFEVDERYKRGYKLDRTDWSWVVLTKFHQEVTAHELEESLLSSPPVLPRSDLFRQATLQLTRAIYSHPTKQQSHSGSAIEFHFDVRLTRR